uniref:non-specific serine/threonine protein kinase n=1 Tax=Tetraselmis sp. GSL018 TaxID=582737 RepID=A0A061RC98_9CHLO
MPLNPFAKEFVPDVSAQVSNLKLGTDSKDKEEAGSLFPETSSPLKTGENPSELKGASCIENKPQELESSDVFHSPQDAGATPVATGQMKDDAPEAGEAADAPQEHAGSGSYDPKEEYGEALQEHQELHHVVPPNQHFSSPALGGILEEQMILDTVEEYIHQPDDVQDIRDAISVPEDDIQTEQYDVVARMAGKVTEGEDPEDVEADVTESHSFAHQGSIFPDGLHQAEDEAGFLSRKLTPQDFELQTVIGQGAFGKVFLVSKRDTGEIFAMKVMRKDKILEKDHSDYVKAEREVLTAVVHPYIVTLQYSFQTSSKLYLIMDFINGGHLFFQLFREGIFTEELARLYTAEIVLAISHLHRCGFVHRDLKPENILLDSDGHVKVTDFGLAKKNVDDDARTNSFIGTMEYMAPEIVNGTGHGKSVDWWSVGILLYEMLAGVPPFRGKSQQSLKKQITGGKIKYPTFLSSEAQNLLKGLLNRDPKKRLGYGPHGSEDVMRHPFFKAIKWDMLLRREVPSPFKPLVKNAQSVENFDKIWTDLPAEDSPGTTPDHPNLDTFKDFSYHGPSMMEQAAIERPEAP